MTTRKIAGETRRRIVLFNVGGMGWHPPSWARQQDKPKWAVEARSKFFAQTVWAGCVAPTALGASSELFPALTRWANLCHASGVWWRPTGRDSPGSVGDERTVLDYSRLGK